MIAFALVAIFFATIQAFQSNTILSNSVLVVRSVAFSDRELYKRAGESRQPASAQGSPSEPVQNTRQRLVQGQNLAQSHHSIQRPDSGQGQPQLARGAQGRGTIQEANRGRGRGRGGAQRENRDQNQARGQIQTRNQVRAQGRGISPAIAPSNTDRFPPLNPINHNPSRRSSVLINTALEGPAHIEGRFGQNYERRVTLNVPAGQSFSHSWYDQHMADVKVTTHPGNSGVSRSFASGSRRASIRIDTPMRKVGLGHDMNIGGPVRDLKLQKSDFGSGRGHAYVRASTRHGPGHVGVDGLSRGSGWQRIRASNSAGSGDSHVSSVSNGEPSTIQGDPRVEDGEVQSGHRRNPRS